MGANVGVFRFSKVPMYGYVYSIPLTLFMPRLELKLNHDRFDSMINFETDPYI